MAYRRLTIIALIVLAASVCASAQETVSLEMKFTPGEVLRYKMVMDCHMTLDTSGPGAPRIPNMKMRMVAVIRQKTKRVLPSGDAEVIATAESMTFSMAGKTRALPRKELSTPMTMMVDRNGQIKSMAGANKLFGRSGMNLIGPSCMGQFGGLPAGDLIVGESWSQNLPGPTGGGKMLLIGRVLSASEMLGSTRVAVIRQDVSGDVDLGATIGAMTDQRLPASAGIKGNARVSGYGTTFFSPEKGRLMRTEGGMEARMQMSGPASAKGGTGSMDVHLQANFEVFLLSAK